VRRRSAAAEREATRAAAAWFRAEPRPLVRPVHGTPRLSVDGEIVLYTPEHDPPFQVERCCTQCGSSDPVRWPASQVRVLAGAEVRVPEGHRCFWCRCYELSSGRSDQAAAPPAALRGGRHRPGLNTVH
jgi:hypothetical protein